MEKEHMAEFLEEMNEHLVHSFESWILSHALDPEMSEQQPVISGFVDWLIAENKEAIVTPRRGGSYEDVRMERHND